MIDWDRVYELRGEVGEEDFGEVIELFLEEVDEVMTRLSAEGSDNLEEDLHFLKGSALNLGFAEFGTLCQAGEKAAASGQGDTVDLAQVISAYHASRSDFMKRADEFGLAA